MNKSCPNCRFMIEEDEDIDLNSGVVPYDAVSNCPVDGSVLVEAELEAEVGDETPL